MVDVNDEHDEYYQAQDILLVDARKPDEQDAQVFKQSFQGPIQFYTTVYIKNGF